MDIDGPRVAVVVVTPHAVQQLAAGIGAAWMGGQHRQKLVLLWPQVDEQPVVSNFVRNGVQHNAIGHHDARPVTGVRPLLEKLQAPTELRG